MAECIHSFGSWDVCTCREIVFTSFCPNFTEKTQKCDAKLHLQQTIAILSEIEWHNLVLTIVPVIMRAFECWLPPFCHGHYAFLRSEHIFPFSKMMYIVSENSKCCVSFCFQILLVKIVLNAVRGMFRNFLVSNWSHQGLLQNSKIFVTRPYFVQNAANSIWISSKPGLLSYVRAACHPFTPRLLCHLHNRIHSNSHC